MSLQLTTLDFLKTEIRKMPQKITDELTEHIEQLVLLGKSFPIAALLKKFKKMA